MLMVFDVDGACSAPTPHKARAIRLWNRLELLSKRSCTTLICFCHIQLHVSGDLQRHLRRKTSDLESRSEHCSICRREQNT